MKALLIALMVWASPVTGLPVPDRVPSVVFRTPCHIIRVVEQRPVSRAECERMQRDGNYPYAFFHDEQERIVLPTHWDRRNVYDMSILAHEVVHFMQHADGTQIETQCPEIEIPAYRAQMRWLTEHGADPADYGLTEDSIKQMSC